jgi:hypothetical protein
MQNCGFKNVMVSKVTVPSGCESPLDLMNGFFIKHPFGKELRNNNPLLFQDIVSEMEQRIKADFGHHHLRFDLSAWIIVGEKP